MVARPIWPSRVPACRRTPLAGLGGGCRRRRCGRGRARAGAGAAGAAGRHRRRGWMRMRRRWSMTRRGSAGAVFAAVRSGLRQGGGGGSTSYLERITSFSVVARRVLPDGGTAVLELRQTVRPHDWSVVLSRRPAGWQAVDLLAGDLVPDRGRGAMTSRTGRLCGGRGGSVAGQKTRSWVAWVRYASRFRSCSRVVSAGGMSRSVLHGGTTRASTEQDRDEGMTEPVGVSSGRPDPPAGPGGRRRGRPRRAAC
jgi:hypothetical protein